MIISPTSEKRLKGVHPDLVRVVRRVARDWADPETGWIITCGARTLEEQKLLVAKGASRTMRSRHLIAPNGFSHAVDFACTIQGVPRWDWNLYIKLANAVKAAAIAEKVTVEWGGSWSLLNSVKGAITAKNLHKSFPDGPHFQLPYSSYLGSQP
jgi:peptidoglycan L-alanyl-D-glutamate endopeptidase CwlK